MDSPAFKFARVHTDERQLADERVGHDLEHQGSERIVVVGLADQFPLGVIGIDAGDRGDFKGEGR